MIGRRSSAYRDPGIRGIVDVRVGWVAVAVGVPGVALLTPLASVTEPVTVPEITAASFAPWMVIVRVGRVRQAAVGDGGSWNVSVVVWPTLRACTVVSLSLIT